MQYEFVHKPQRVDLFVQKDPHGKLVHSYCGADIAIRKVACGRNHSICVEDWEECTIDTRTSDAHAQPRLNRVFTFGFGGYGRLGHGSGSTADELAPRELVIFSHNASGSGTLTPTRPTK